MDLKGLSEICGINRKIQLHEHDNHHKHNWPLMKMINWDKKTCSHTTDTCDYKNCALNQFIQFSFFMWLMYRESYPPKFDYTVNLLGHTIAKYLIYYSSAINAFILIDLSFRKHTLFHLRQGTIPPIPIQYTSSSGSPNSRSSIVIPVDQHFRTLKLLIIFSRPPCAWRYLKI